MKILFVLNTGFDTQGPSNHLLEAIIQALLLDGCKVHIIEKHKTGHNPDIPVSISGNTGLTYDICKVKNVKKANFMKRYLVDIKYAISCLRFYIKQQDIDAVFLQSCNTAFFQILFLKMFIKKPVIFNVQDIFPLNALMIGMLREKSLVYKILKLLQKCAYNMADMIITISDDMKKTILDEEVQEDKVHVIYNWSYSDEIIEITDENNKFLRDNNINNNHYKVVYAGNIGALQNIDIIMTAARLLKDEKGICFYIIGDGVLKDKYIKHAYENDLKNVMFYPMQSSDYAPHIYSMADVNIIPLGKNVIWTALPSKAAICLSCGKPIIACIDKDSSFAKMIKGCDKCSVIDSDDAEGFANRIKEYYHNNTRGYSSGERQLFKNNFLKSMNVNRYTSLIKQLMGSD